MRYTSLLVPLCAAAALAVPIAQSIAPDAVPEIGDEAIPLVPILPGIHRPDPTWMGTQASDSNNDAIRARDAGSAPAEQPDDAPEEEEEDVQTPQVQLKKVKIKPGKKKVKWLSADGTKCKAKCKSGKPCEFSGRRVCQSDWATMGFADEENEVQEQE